ncbi:MULTISPECIES: hypothetical protein [Corynebacterium]|uniref:Secreted protein n=1 Tax=Corynebacterium lehmanniae TaxID=2913497 RepID=A0ABT4RAL0_9CORY|nr:MULTISPECIES: hypothetical protein [Corynebacterium]MCG7236910.1 hypothetical protein [Corynebacterium sp. ACRQP]MCZ9292574.1 hypothetical protein [Corynebacterium lehmanniae]
MKRITSAALAATMSVSVLAAPAFAAEGDSDGGSSKAYQECIEAQKKIQKDIDNAPTEKEKELRRKAVDKTYEELGVGSSTDSGVCIKSLTHEDSKYRSSALGVLIGVPLALVALLGAAAAFSGSIPGVSLPAIPGLPM